MKKPDDIANIEQRIGTFKKNKNTESVDISEKSPHSGAAKGFQLSVELVSAVLIGAAMGYFLDILFGLKPWLLCLFTVFGGAAGILNVYRSAKAEDEGER